MTTSPTGSTTTLKAGVVGLGWAGQQHMDAYAHLPGVELVAIAGMEDEPRAALGTKYGVTRLYRDWKELVAEGDLDVISVAVPTFLHAPIAVGALDAGIHVLSEKPIARTAREAESMVDAATGRQGSRGRLQSSAPRRHPGTQGGDRLRPDRPAVPRARRLAPPRRHPRARQLVHQP